MFKKLLGDKLKKYSGQKDFLEAVCAACALVASADGDVSDAEIEATIKAIMSNAVLSANYNSREIEQCAEAMLKRAQGGRMGRMGLMREIEEACSDADKAEAIVLAALDVAEGDGNIDEKEMAVLNKIGTTAGVDIKRLMEV